MARSGDLLVNKATGFQLRFLKTSSDTNGELLEMEATYPPGTPPPPEHFHPNQEERFTVLRGSLRASIAGEPRTLSQGDRLVIPPRTPHQMWNDSPHEAVLQWETRPSLRTEEMFEVLMRLGKPGLLDLALLVPEFDREMRVTRPSRAIQKVLFALLAPVARLTGRGR